MKRGSENFLPPTSAGRASAASSAQALGHEPPALARGERLVLRFFGAFQDLRLLRGDLFPAAALEAVLQVVPAGRAAEAAVVRLRGADRGALLLVRELPVLLLGVLRVRAGGGEKKHGQGGKRAHHPG